MYRFFSYRYEALLLNYDYFGKEGISKTFGFRQLHGTDVYI